MAEINIDKIRPEYATAADWEPVSGIAIGYPGNPDHLSEELRQKELAPPTRKPLSSFVFTGHWGTPADLVVNKSAG